MTQEERQIADFERLVARAAEMHFRDSDVYSCSIDKRESAFATMEKKWVAERSSRYAFRGRIMATARRNSSRHAVEAEVVYEKVSDGWEVAAFTFDIEDREAWSRYLPKVVRHEHLRCFVIEDLGRATIRN